MRARLLVPTVLILLLATGTPLPAAAQTGATGADAFEAAYLFITEEYLRPVAPPELLTGAVAGLNEYLRGRGLPPQRVTLTGAAAHDVPVVREAIAGVGRRLGTAAAARDSGYAAISGMLRVVSDPFTRLVLPTAGPRDTRPGGYSGVGIVVGLEVNPPVVVEVIDGGPAQRAGLRRGDIIMEIDGRSTITMLPQEVASRLRGQPGTSVVMRVRRGGGELTVTIVREIIGLRRTSYHVSGAIGYLHLEDFDEGAGEEVTAVVAELQRLGARGLIFDLRGNPGGFLDEAIAIASIFLPRGTVTTLVGKNGQRTRLNATPGGLKFTGPVVVLTDRKTASAAEMVAGALQDAGQAVIGTRSYGKGTVQELRRLPGGAVLQLTVAQYLTPNGAVVDGRGIQPQLEMEAAEGTFGTDDDRVVQAARQWLEIRLGALFRLVAAAA